DEEGRITDDSRIQASLETIRYALERGAKVVIGSHLGDPGGEIRKLEAKYQQEGLSREAAMGRAGREIFKKMSLSSVAQRLQELLPDVKVHFRARFNWTMSDASEFIQGKMKPGEVFLLENVRFNPEEKGKKDTYFAGDLMKGADVIVSDGFSVAHRNDVSVTGRPGKNVPRVAGLAFVREARALEDVRKNARTIVMGGSKVLSKIRVIRQSLNNRNVGKIMVGGGMANAFFVAKGFSVGATVVGTEPADVEIARTLLDNSKVVIPSDVVAVDSFDAPAESMVINFDNGEAVPDGWVIVDIGPATIAKYKEIIARDGLTFWNGPMGAFDVKSVAQFARKGTNGVGEAVADARGVVGGGDTGKAVKLFGLTGYSYVSTAGGAALEFLEGKVLPGIAALSDKMISSEDIVMEAPVAQITDFLKPGVGVADALQKYWQTGGRGPVSLLEIVVQAGLDKELVLAAINGINGNFNSPFSVEPDGLNKRLDNETRWIQLVARRPLGEFRQPSQGLQPRASSPVEGLEVALVGGRDRDVVRNMRLIGQLLTAGESSQILVGGVTALVLMEARNWINRADYNYEPQPIEKEINGKKKMVDVRIGILSDARSYMNHSRVVLPSQVEVMDPKNPAVREVVHVGRGEKVPQGKVVVGFGEQTIRTYADIISGSKSTFWNGPMDVDGTAQGIVDALVQAQRRGPLFVGEDSADAAKAVGLTGSVLFSNNDLSKFLGDKAMKGGRVITISQEKDMGHGAKIGGQEEPGGINLDPALLDLQIRRDANFVPLPLPQQPIETMRIEGFIPVIINITPVMDLPLLLGLAGTGAGEDETRPDLKAREPEEISVLN
ncbi:MAG: phosphoglycerate kinase, partial [Candidatus Omnitrophica bacterium]|nr:phosphoglycerate kinase [Candidatus Omnitrophota bacterium]